MHQKLVRNAVKIDTEMSGQKKIRLMFYAFKKLSPSVDLEREMGNEGDRTIGVFFLDILMRAS